MAKPIAAKTTKNFVFRTRRHLATIMTSDSRADARDERRKRRTGPTTECRHAIERMPRSFASRGAS
jgi:hypothetical protein